MAIFKLEFDESEVVINGKKNAHYSLKQYDKVLATLNQAINPKPTGAYHARSVVYKALGEDEKPKADKQDIKETNPDAESDALIHIDRGRTHFYSGEYEQALADYDRAIAIDPESLFAYFYRASVYKKLEQYDKALADYNKAISFYEFASFYNGRGDLYHKLKQYDKAIADYTEAIAISFSSESAYSYKSRGYTYQELGKIEEAKKDWEKAASLYQQEGNMKQYREIQQQLQKL